MEDIDVRVVIKKLLRKWYWFALSLVVAVGLASAYLATTVKLYLVQSTIQLKDRSLGDKGVAQEKLLSGFELLESNAELEDEISILTSYSTVYQSLDRLDYEVSYYEYPAGLGSTGKRLAKEVYPAPFKIKLDTAGWQLMYHPVYISFPDSQHYRVKVEVPLEDQPVYLYNTNSHSVLQKKQGVELDTILNISKTLSLPYLNVSLSDLDPWAWEGDKSYFIYVSSIDDLTENYYGQLAKTAPVSEKSNIVKLSLHSAVPEKDIVFLNTLSQVYIDNTLIKKNVLGERTIDFIEGQLQRVTDSLRQTESKLQTFRSDNQVIDVAVTSQNLTHQLNGLEEKQAQLEVQNKYYKYMSDYLKRNDNVMDVVAPSSVGIQDPFLNSLLVQLSTLNAEKINKDFSSNAQNPVMQVLEKKIKSTKQALLDNITALVRSNQIALKDNGDRIKEIKRTMNRLPKNERDLVDIQRRFTHNDNIYNYLLQRRAEAGISIASNLPEKKVIDSARQIGWKPVSPNAMFIFLISIIMGLMVPAGFIFVKDFFQPKVQSVEQLNNWTDIPILDRIAQVKDKEKDSDYVGESYLAHSFRYIRQHLNILQLSQETKTIGVTSAKSGEGKTFCAINLAKSFVMAGRKTLLIDADLHRPTLAQKLNLEEQAGISDYLLRGERPNIREVDERGLYVLSAGMPNDNPSDLLTHHRLASLIASLREQYDVIIIDTPPMGTIADYLILSKHIDYTLIVVRHDYSEKEEVQRLDKLTKRHQLSAGIIYNGTSLPGNYEGYYRKLAKKGIA